MYPELNAEEFLTYIAILKGMRQRDTRQQRVRQLLEAVSLSQVARRPLKTYSGGMKRRVGIAQALLNDPQLLIVDEPTAGLDPEERIRVRNLLAEVGNERTVLLSTHIVEDIAQTCHRLAVLKDGQIIYEGETSELAKMAHGRVWTLTSSGIKPQGDLVVVSTINQGSSIQYRVIGTPPIEGSAYPAQPTLEDGYVWLMQTSKQPG